MDICVHRRERHIPTPRFTIASVNSTVVRVTAEDGSTGIGHSYAWTPGAAHAIQDLVSEMAPWVVGSQVARIRERISLLEREYVSFLGMAGIARVALSALDMALWDCWCTVVGRPLQDLLGRYQDAIPTYVASDLWPTASPDECATIARGFVDRGFTGMKMWVNSKDVAWERERVTAVREGAGVEARVIVDAAQSYSVSEAIRLADAIAGCNVSWFEDPVRHDDVAGLVEVAAHSPVPIGTGEHCYGPEGVKRVLDSGAVRTMVLDLQRVGGISGLLSAAALCEAYGVDLTTHCYPHASARVLAAARAGTLVEYTPLWDDLFGEPVIEGGRIVPDDSPGATASLVRDLAFQPVTAG
jgi:mandelate racemase